MRRLDFVKKQTILFPKVILNHARIWPRGYPGDYKIIEGPL